MALVLQFNCNGPMQGSKQKTRPTGQRGVPTNLGAEGTESELRKSEKFSQKDGNEWCAMTQKKTKNEQHEKFSQAATSSGAQRRKKMPIV